MEKNFVRLSTIGGGALEEMFEDAMKVVADNINDPNTEAESVVEYVNLNPDKITSINGKANLLINVNSHNSVDVWGQLNGNKDRDHYLKAEIESNLSLNGFMQLEDFILQMQSSFKETLEQKEVLKFASNLTDELIQTNKDDGISQSAVIRSGIVKLEKVTVPNPVELIPYRTFPEIDQPKGLFILRAQKTSSGPQLGLFDCNSNGWKLKAVTDIKDYLKKHLKGNIIL